MTALGALSAAAALAGCGGGQGTARHPRPAAHLPARIVHATAPRHLTPNTLYSPRAPR